MDITNFILSGQLDIYKVGCIIKLENDLIEVTKQDGDIPSIYQLNNDNYVIFLEALDNKIIRIVIDLSYEIDEKYYFDNEANFFEFNYDTSLDKTIIFLNKIGLECLIINNQLINEDTSTRILFLPSSNLYLVFYEEENTNLLKIYSCS